MECLARINTRQEAESEISADHVAPFVKWAGGKRSVIGELVARLPTQFGDYYEPFVGGGALFFEIHNRLRQAFLSDMNLDLMVTYRIIKTDLDALLVALKGHAAKHNEVHYYRVRHQHDLQDPVQVAARFLYLNRTCYNGFYRVNKQGEFNVPIGRYANPNILNEANLRLCHAVLRKARVEYCPFETIRPHRGDFVYFDPPYHPLRDTSFTKYTRLDFAEPDHVRLRNFALGLHRAGVHIMLSNADTPFIKSLYHHPAFRVTIIQAPRYINCKPYQRSAVDEVLITTY